MGKNSGKNTDFQKKKKITYVDSFRFKWELRHVRRTLKAFKKLYCGSARELAAVVATLAGNQPVCGWPSPGRACSRMSA